MKNKTRNHRIKRTLFLAVLLCVVFGIAASAAAFAAPVRASDEFLELLRECIGKELEYTAAHSADISSINVNTDYSKYTVRMQTSTVSDDDQRVAEKLFSLSETYGSMAGEENGFVRVEYVGSSGTKLWSTDSESYVPPKKTVASVPMSTSSSKTTTTATTEATTEQKSSSTIKTEAFGDLVWVTNNDDYFHSSDSCGKINGTAFQLMRSLAEKRGYVACDSCW
jgi:hypothetical protein